MSGIYPCKALWLEIVLTGQLIQYHALHFPEPVVLLISTVQS